MTPSRAVNKYREPYDILIMRPSKWGNPYSHKAGTMAEFVVASRDEAVSRYREWVLSRPELMASIGELRGKRLGCCCKPKPCHGDVLAEIVNERFNEIPDLHQDGRPEVDSIGVPEADHKRYFCYVDVETTGLYPKDGDEMIEIAVACVEYGDTGIRDIVDEYRGFREPVKRIPPEATSINGITWEMVEGTKFDDQRVMNMLGGAEFLAAHNYRFDREFMSYRYPDVLYKPWRCTRDGIKWSRRGMSSRKLQDLLAAHGIDPGQAHRAMDDVKAAVRLLGVPGVFDEWMG